LFQGKVNGTDPVEAATYNTFKKLNLDTTLSKLNRILDTEHFALVVHNQRLYTSEKNIQEREVIVGIVTDIDLLQYIARHESGSSPDGSGSISPRNSQTAASK